VRHAFQVFLRRPEEFAKPSSGSKKDEKVFEKLEEDF
jgi:hypothetical protein